MDFNGYTTAITLGELESFLIKPFTNFTIIIDNSEKEFSISKEIALQYYNTFYLSSICRGLEVDEENLIIPLFLDNENNKVISLKEIGLFSEEIKSLDLEINGENFTVIQIDKEDVFSMLEKNTDLFTSFEDFDFILKYDELSYILSLEELKNLKFLSLAVNKEKVLLCFDDNIMTAKVKSPINVMELNFIIKPKGEKSGKNRN